MEETSCAGSDKRRKAEKKPRERNDKRKSLRKKNRKGFCGKAFVRSTGNNNELATQSTSTSTTRDEENYRVSTENHDVYNVSAMGKKIGEPLKTTPVKMLTRKRKRDSNLTSNDICPADGYKIIDSSILQSVLNTISKCTSCGFEKTLQLKQNNQKKRGMCETLMLYCTSCKQIIKTFNTSKTVAGKKMLDINLRSVVATTSAGGGLTSLRRICTDLNLPQPITEHPYNSYIKHVEKNAIENCERSLLDAAGRLRRLKLNGVDDKNIVVDVPVSVDGSWQKRYGFNSLLGMIFLLSIDTGSVLDYEIKSLICHECKRTPNATESWKETHKEVCLINHTGSSGAMEKEGAVAMFMRSIQKHNMRYTVYVGDGDSSSFGAVRDAVHAKFGDDGYPIEKEDCIGHIQKRMGAALRSYKNNCRGRTLADGKGVGGAGRLTDVVIDRIQTYYGYAIRNNKGDTGKIIEAIWAIYYHTIAGPSYESLQKQHSFCPKSSDSWCRYNKDMANGTNEYAQQRSAYRMFSGLN